MNTAHCGWAKTRFYRIWYEVCWRSQKDENYVKLGIAKRWLKFPNFMADMFDAYTAHVLEHGEDDTTIDRKDNSKGYFPKNCRWATYSVQNSNKKGTKFYTNGGVTDTLSGWASRLGITPATLQYRLRLWPNEEALTPKSPTKTWKHRKNCEKFPKP